MSLTLYHCAHARSLRPLWCLEEMGLDYELVNLPFPPRVFAKEYKEINPLGTIPFLIDGETRMSESSGSCFYLTHFSDATLTFPQTLVLRYTQLEPEERRIQQVSDDYGAWFSGRLRHVETALEDRTYLVADRFTIADIAIGYALHLADRLPPIKDRLGPNATAYLTGLRARDGFLRALEKQKT